MCNQKQKCIDTMTDRFSSLNLEFVSGYPSLANEIDESDTKKIITVIDRNVPSAKGKLKADGSVTIDTLERDVKREIAQYAAGPMVGAWAEETCWDNDPLLRIFLTIQAWGGQTGRQIFVQKGGLNWPEVRPRYKRLVDVCTNKKSTIEDIQDAGILFDYHVYGAGISFITKHIHFWTQVVRGEDSLPIFDDIMATGLGVPNNWKHVDCYWEGMQQLWNRHDKDPWPENMESFERQLFKHFINMNKGSDKQKA